MEVIEGTNRQNVLEFIPTTRYMKFNALQFKLIKRALEATKQGKYNNEVIINNKDNSELSDWDDLENEEVKEDPYYQNNLLGSEDFLADENKDNTKSKIRSLLGFYENAVCDLIQHLCLSKMQQIEIIAKEILRVKTEDLQAVLNEYMSPFLTGVRKQEYCKSSRFVVLLCISRNFLNHERTDDFRFLCNLVENVIEHWSGELFPLNIECFLKIQSVKNLYGNFDYFDDLFTGISSQKFEIQLKLCYSKQILSTSKSNVSDQFVEKYLQYFISSFDEVTENRKDQFKIKKKIFRTLIEVLNKFIVKENSKNIKITLEALQKIIRNFVIVDCFQVFIKYMFRDSSLPRTSQQKYKMWLNSILLEEDLLKSVCGFIIEFLRRLKSIRKHFYSVIEVSTLFEEMKCIYKCLIETLHFILREEKLDSEKELKHKELKSSNKPLIFELDADKATILPIYVDTSVDYSEDKGIVNTIKEMCDMEEMTWINKDIVLKSISDIASIRYHKQHCQLAKIILDINLIKVKGDFLIHQITLKLWDLLKISNKRKSKNNIETHRTAMKKKVQHKFTDMNNCPVYREEDVYDENELQEIKTILYRCICILRNAKKQAQFSDVNITDYTNAFDLNEQSLENEDQAGKKSNTGIMLIIMVLLLVAATRHHKSAKLKKYLSQKYEYKEAILYILWCSGDIHINPGPPMKKSRLLHDSQRERAWIQDMSSILLKLYKGEPPHSKPKHLWREKPDHWPSNKPFYDTKNHPHDESGRFVSDNELLKCLIQCCDCKKVTINDMFKKEITAWTENKSQLLHKLHTFRTETEKIKMVLQNLLNYKDTDELKEALDNINVKLCLKIGDSGLKNDPRKRLKNQSEMIADTTRYLSAVVCKIVKGKDPESKCDGIWTTPPEPWPTDVPFFSPFNRGKCEYTCSDQLLLSTLLQHPKAVIPPKYKSLVEAFQTVVNSTDKKEDKKHKKVLCRVKTIQTDVSVLDYALKYLHSDGFFTLEVFHPLHQWWSGQSVDNKTEIKFENLHRISEERPRVFIEVTRECMTMSVMQSTIDDKTKSEVCYNISFGDSLPTALDSNSQHCSDFDQQCNDDNSHGTSVKKNSQIPHKQKSSSDAASLNESNHGTDITQYSFTNNDNETDSSTTNETLFTRHKLLPVESSSLSLSKLKKSKANTTPTTVSISEREETLAKDSDETNYPTDVSGINLHHAGQCDYNERAIVPETNESQVFIEKQTKGKKRKLSNESNDNGMNKLLLMENKTKNDVHKKIEETVSDHHIDVDFFLKGCIDDIPFQHKSTSELSKKESSFGRIQDGIIDISLPVSTDYDEVSDGIAIQSDDLINFILGKGSRIEKELLLDS